MTISWTYTLGHPRYTGVTRNLLNTLSSTFKYPPVFKIHIIRLILLKNICSFLKVNSTSHYSRISSTVTQWCLLYRHDKDIILFLIWKKSRLNLLVTDGMELSAESQEVLKSRPDVSLSNWKRGSSTGRSEKHIIFLL